MPYKDKEQQATYQREWQRQRRAGESKPAAGRTLNPEDFKTAQGIRDLLSSVLAEVMAWQGDTLIRARCIGYIAAIAIKAVETADLEQRLNEIERNLEGRHEH